MSQASMRTFFLGLGLSLFAFLGCQTPAPQAVPGFMWEAKRGSQVLTLVGTMHFGIKQDELPAQIWQQIDAAEKVLIETDLDAMSPSLLRQFFQMPEGRSLERELGPEHWKLFVGLMQSAFPGITLEQLRSMTPAAACSQLLMAEAQKDAPADDQRPMDELICQRARNQAKACGQFEKPEEQLGYLQEVFTVDLLRTMLIDPQGEDYARLKRAYREGRTDVIEEMIDEMPAAMRKVLLEERNLRWARELDHLLSPHHTLIAVGAAHFGGRQSLLKLLREKGFAVVPLLAPSQAPQP